MAKLRDIAAKTGMATSTVAAILRNAPGFNADTRARVLGVAQEMGYRPNFLSKALAGGASMTLGVMVTSFDPALMWKVQAFETCARQAGYLTFVVFAQDRAGGLTVDVARGLLDRRVDGLVIYSLHKPDDALVKYLAKIKVPTVFIDWAPKGERRHIAIEHEQGMHEVAQHLAGLGHRDAVFIGIDFDREHPEHKVEPYRKAFKQAGVRLEADDALMVSADGATGGFQEPIHDAVKKYFKRPRPATAVVTCDDEIAIFIHAALRAMKLEVPRDVSLVGFDDHPVASQVSPALTTLRQPRGAVGLAAFDMLRAMLGGQGDAEVSPVVFKASLVVRESTGAPRREP